MIVETAAFLASGAGELGVLGGAVLEGCGCKDVVVPLGASVPGDGGLSGGCGIMETSLTQKARTRKCKGVTH